MMPKSYRPRGFHVQNYNNPSYGDRGPRLPYGFPQQYPYGPNPYPQYHHQHSHPHQWHQDNFYLGSEMPQYPIPGGGPIMMNPNVRQYRAPAPLQPGTMAKYILPAYSSSPNAGLFYSRTDIDILQAGQPLFQSRRNYSKSNKDTTTSDNQSVSKSSVQPSVPATATGSSYSHVAIEMPLSQKELTRSFIKEISDLRSKLKDLRKWEYTQLGKMIGSSMNKATVGGGTRFTLLCHNVLAQSLLTQHMNLYKGCDPRALNHSFRKQLFFSDMDELRPDIVCLQEVTEIDYYKVHEPTLFLKGYKGVYKKRTGDKLDGCAIFYQTSKFRFIEKLAVEYCQPHSHLLNRDNIALFVKLKTNKYGGGPQQTVVVGTTHILFNPKRMDVKFGQVQLLLAELDRIAFSGLDTKGNPIYHPVIITGDFNAEPTSSLVRFLTSGVFRQEIRDSLPPLLGISDQCQHYKVVLERLKHFQKHRKSSFQLDSKVEPSLVNLRSNSANSTAELSLGNDSYNVEFCNSELFPPLTTNTPFPEQSQNNLNSTSKKSVSFSDDVELNSQSQLSTADKMSLEAYKSFSSHRLESSKESSASVGPGQLITEINQVEHKDILDCISKHGQLCTFESGDLQHNFRLSNVYAPQLDRGEGSLGTATTKQIGWTTVDYIFYSKIWNEHHKKQTEGKLRLIRRLGLLTRDQCKEMGPIPNFAASSDHYSLVAEFVLK